MGAAILHRGVWQTKFEQIDLQRCQLLEDLCPTQDAMFETAAKRGLGGQQLIIACYELLWVAGAQWARRSAGPTREPEARWM